MKVIIAGSRTIRSVDHALGMVRDAVAQSGFQIAEVVSGMAQGIDCAGWYWAKDQNIPIKEFPADWYTHGKAAGPIRNNQMAEYADALIAIWNGQSRGTKHMIEAAKKRGLKVFVFDVSKTERKESVRG